MEAVGVEHLQHTQILEGGVWCAHDCRGVFSFQQPDDRCADTVAEFGAAPLAQTQKLLFESCPDVSESSRDLIIFHREIVEDGKGRHGHFRGRYLGRREEQEHTNKTSSPNWHPNNLHEAILVRQVTSQTLVYTRT